MCTRRHRCHQDHVAGKDMEERQRAHDVVLLGIEEPVPDPAIIDHPGIEMLRHLRHPRRPAGMEIAGDAVFLRILELQRRGLLGDLLPEVLVIGVHATFELGTQEGHDPALGRGQVAQQIHLEHGLHIGRVAHRLRRLLGDVGLRKGLQRDDHLGVRLPQDRGDLLGLQQRVDRVRDPGHGPAQQRQHGLVAVGQDVGHDVLRSDAQRPEEVRGLRDARVQVLPGQRFRLVAGPRKDLVAYRLVARKLRAGVAQQLVERGRDVPLRPRHLRFDCIPVVDPGKAH